MTRTMLAATLAALAATACGGDHECPEELDTMNIWRRVTIGQGVYGQLSVVPGEGECAVRTAAEAAVVLLGEGRAVVAGPVTTDVNGFFQIAAEPGQYSLCLVATPRRCIQVELDRPRLLRRDFEFGGLGWSVEFVPFLP